MTKSNKPEIVVGNHAFWTVLLIHTAGDILEMEQERAPETRLPIDGWFLLPSAEIMPIFKKMKRLLELGYFKLVNTKSGQERLVPDQKLKDLLVDLHREALSSPLSQLFRERSVEFCGNFSIGLLRGTREARSVGEYLGFTDSEGHLLPRGGDFLRFAAPQCFEYVVAELMDDRGSRELPGFLTYVEKGEIGILLGKLDPEIRGRVKEAWEKGRAK